MNKIISFVKTHWIILTISVFAFLIRLYNLTKISLWHDEAFSALLVKYSWGEMMYRIGLDVHPPMYYIFLRVWHYVFGHSLFSLRLMSVTFGLGTVILIYFFVKRFFKNQTAALLAAALVAVNPFQIQYVTEARMYTMGGFFAVLAAYLLGLALEYTVEYYKKNKKQIKSKMLWSYFGFTISASILMYTHYYLLFTVAALGLYGIWFIFSHYKFDLKKYLWLALSGAGLGVLYLPWLKWFLYQYNQVGAGYWIPPINIWSVPNTLYELTIRIANPGKFLMVLVTIAVVWVIVGFIRKYQEPEKWLSLGLFLAPFGGAFLFALLAWVQNSESSVYLVRYFIFASPFFLAMLGLWLNKLKVFGLKQILIALLVIVNLFSVIYYWTSLKVDEKGGMAVLAQTLNANLRPNDKIYVGSSFEFFNYKYYHNYVYKNPENVTPLLYTNGNTVEDLPHYAGTAILTNEDLVLNFEDSVSNGDTVWVIWTNGFGGTKPVVPKNWTQISEYGEAEVRPYVGTWVVATAYKVN